ncbi:acyl-CoA dehydrogenase family protein [Streptosporangium sp. NPDC049248]|uniref:acyl-CoA dehydrogenase family protein n=1 Tax=Streptosporangium sp. NPDC049248 TaxID=3155651 RepID=UPI00341630FC
MSEFVRAQVVPHEERLNGGGSSARAASDHLAAEAKAAGLWGLPLPAELGGGGLLFTEYAHLAEAEGASEHGPATLGSVTLPDVTTLGEHAAPAVLDHYLDGIIDGRLRVCDAHDRRNVTNDPEPHAPRAVRASDGSWELYGRAWLATDADLILVPAGIDGPQPDHQGTSLFLLPAAAPAIGAAGRLREATADRWRTLILDGVTVPADHLIGRPGKGRRVLTQRSRLATLLHCLHGLGRAEQALMRMCERVRSGSGKTRGRLDLFQVHGQVFDMFLAIRTTRPVVFEAVARMEAGLDTRLETGLAKVATARMLQQVTRGAAQIHSALDCGAPPSQMPATGRPACLPGAPEESHLATVSQLLG